jgi:hypothetical protein
MNYRYCPHPVPHLVIDELVSPPIYRRMRFPDELIEPGASWGITSSDPQYAEILRDPDWCSLHDELRGEPFVRGVLEAFGDDLRREGCMVAPDRARLVPFTESREEKEARTLFAEGNPNEVFTRLDFQSKAHGGYREFVHLDWPRRIVGGILYFSDAAEEGLDGGELALFRDRDFRDDRWCHDPEQVATFAPRHNTGVIFLNSNRGFHGPRAIRRLEGRRRWLYFTISSKLDVWPLRGRGADEGNVQPAGRDAHGRLIA